MENSSPAKRRFRPLSLGKAAVLVNFAMLVRVLRSVGFPRTWRISFFLKAFLPCCLVVDRAAMIVDGISMPRGQALRQAPQSKHFERISLNSTVLGSVSLASR